MTILLTRPYYDKATHYLYHWTGALSSEAKRRGIKVLELEKGKVKKNVVISYLKKHKPDYVVFNGHGDYGLVCGQDDDILIRAGENEAVISGMHVFVRACRAARTLGPAAMRAGAKSFIGYREDFVFLHDPNNVRHPIDDKLAAPFFEASNRVVLSLIKGKSPLDAHKEGQQAHIDEIDRLSLSGSELTYLVPFLQWNLINQVCL